MFKLKHCAYVAGLATCTFIGFKTYNYFFDFKQPSLELIGLKDQGYYCGNIDCSLLCDKSGSVNVWLDGKPLVKEFKINRADVEQPFTVQTRTLSQGMHQIKLELVDSTYHRNKVVHEATFFVDNVPLQAAFVKPDSEFKVLQGRTLKVQFQVNKEIHEAKVLALSETFNCWPEAKNSSIYECLIPISCEEVANEYLLTVAIKDHVGTTLNLENKFQILPAQFKTQKLTLSAEHLAKEKALGDDSSLFEQTIATLATESPNEKLWRGTFSAPIDIVRTTCDFGTLRITQEKGKYRHCGVDVINAPKSVVWAPQAGKVVLKNRYANSGNTVVVDHGHGVLSMFFHLDSIADINVGDSVAMGNRLGTIGKTGYADGYHLHWEMRINNKPVDPMQWVKLNF